MALNMPSPRKNQMMTVAIKNTQNRLLGDGCIDVITSRYGVYLMTWLGSRTLIHACGVSLA